MASTMRLSSWSRPRPARHSNRRGVPDRGPWRPPPSCWPPADRMLSQAARLGTTPELSQARPFPGESPGRSTGLTGVVLEAGRDVEEIVAVDDEAVGAARGRHHEVGGQAVPVVERDAVRPEDRERDRVEARLERRRL